MLGLRASGFGQDDKEKKIVVEKDIFNEWVMVNITYDCFQAYDFQYFPSINFFICLHFVFEFKSHNNVAKLYNKPFPFFNELQQVYGKDRANGENAEDSYDAVKVMEKEIQQNVNGQQESQTNMQHEGLDEFLDGIYDIQ